MSKCKYDVAKMRRALKTAKNALSLMYDPDSEDPDNKGNPSMAAVSEAIDKIIEALKPKQPPSQGDGHKEGVR